MAEEIQKVKRCEAGELFLGLHGYSSEKHYSMGSITRKVLHQAEDLAVCIVP